LSTVDQDLEVVSLSPPECLVEVVDASHVRLVVSEDEERYRDPYQVDTSVRQVGEVSIRDVGVPVHLEPLPFGELAQLRAQVRLIFCRGPGEELRAHPLLQDEPVAEVHAFGHGPA
jgi:hypothetical protein